MADHNGHLRMRPARREIVIGNCRVNVMTDTVPAGSALFPSTVRVISDQEPCAIEAGKDVGEPLLTQRIVAQHHYFGFRYARPQAAADLRKRARWLPPPTVVRFTDFSPKG